MRVAEEGAEEGVEASIDTTEGELNLQSLFLSFYI